jgi:hypothetical protein
MSSSSFLLSSSFAKKSSVDAVWRPTIIRLKSETQKNEKKTKNDKCIENNFALDK